LVVSNSDYATYKFTNIGKLLNGKYFREICYDLLEILLQNFEGGSEESNDKN